MLVTASTSYEQKLWQSKITAIAGVDEVGRGAWAGPLVVGAVIFPPNFTTELPINDSKKVPQKLREALAMEIKQRAIAHAIVEVELNIINTSGIGYAAQCGFSRVLSQLNPSPEHVLVDAFTIKDYPLKQQTAIIHGDSLSLSIAAASIIAKVHRDALMQRLDKIDPRYGFAKHVGYGTAGHRAAIKEYGLSDHHRTSYDLAKWL